MEPDLLVFTSKSELLVFTSKFETDLLVSEIAKKMSAQAQLP